MIKASELMVGDKVLHDGKYKEVITIWPRSVSLYDSSQTWGSIYADNHTESEIEPIPLTPEILEKNTSERNKNVFGEMNYALNADFFIENRGDRFCLSRRMSGHKYSTFWVCDIHYVHELQHCLKLLGIDKEIVL